MTIDIHSHFLPGVDDGPCDDAGSDKMLEVARLCGTKGLVATPHADLRYRYDPQHCRELLAELQGKHPDMALYLGCEVHLTPENIARVAADPMQFTLNGGDCILLELPDRMVPVMVDPAIEAMADYGLRTIIAHPERNRYIQHAPYYADRLVDSGCFLQLTARSLSGSFGHAAAVTATYILKRRLAHFLASDAHGATVRRPDLFTAFDTVAKVYGKPAAQMLIAGNPEAALHRAPISVMPVAPSWFASFFSCPDHVYRKTVLPEMR